MKRQFIRYPLTLAVVLSGAFITSLAEAGRECNGDCRYQGGEGVYRESIPLRTHGGETIGRVDIAADSWKKTCRSHEDQGGVHVTKISSTKVNHSRVDETYYK